MAPGSRKLFLIDGNSLAYRAYFALPESIATSEGVPTNAIFGFATMLIKILSEHGSQATVVAWDAGMSGRESQYGEYKAGRPPRPDLLSAQWPSLGPLAEAFGYENVKIDGYEADDVIASLAEQAKEKGIDVTIVTGDRDAYQLIDDGNGNAAVQVMTTARGITDTKTYNRQAVIERYGVAPELIADLIGLKGDSSDNIPGVPGIGDKTAAQLLQQFGSLEGVLENIDKISGPKRRQNLEQFADQARLSKQLAILKRDLDCGIDLERPFDRALDTTRLRRLFNEFELREPMRRLQQVLTEQSGQSDQEASKLDMRPPSTHGSHETSDASPSDLDRFLTVQGGALTADRVGDRLLWAVSTEGGQVLLGTAESLEQLIVAWGDRPFIAHDYKAVVRRTAEDGEGECPMPANFAHDTLIAAYLLNPLRRHYDLEFLIEQEGIATGEIAADGLSRAANAIWRLAKAQSEELAANGLERLFRDIELPLIGVLCAMERVGVKLDTYRLGEISAKVTEQLYELEHEICGMAGEEFTIGSPQQLAVVLFEKLGLTRKRRGKTGYSTDAKVLRSIRHEHPIIEKVERWRELSKLKSTYLDALPDWISDRTGRLHTTFNQVGAATGRLSSTEPNLQNIPVRTPLGREIRDCFVAEEGNCLLTADYSQVELRILAALADEPVLKEIFKGDGDIHTTTAAEVFGLEGEQIGVAERSRAKAVNFGIIYGLTPHGLSEQLEISYEQAKEYIDRYMGRFPAVRAFIDETVAKATDQGFVSTLFGRVREIPELRASQPHGRALGERLAVNTVIQGTAADVIKIAMVNCCRALRDRELRTQLVLQIHDELLFEGPRDEADEAAQLVRTQMESAYDLDPPLRADVGVGETWLSAK